MAALALFRRPSDFGLDPISLEPIVDPVIDQCGHTFNRSTIDDLVHAARPGEAILCPISRKAIDVDRLSSNLFAKEALGYCDALEQHERQAAEKFRVAERDFSKRMDAAQKEIAGYKKVNSRNKQQMQDDFSFRLAEREKSFIDALHKRDLEISEDRKEMKKMMDLMIEKLTIKEGKIDALTGEIRVLKREVKSIKVENRRLMQKQSRMAKNVLEMTVTDRLLVTFGECVGRPHHLQQILERNIKKA